MGRLSICGARVVMPGKDLGVTTFSVDAGRIAAVGASVPLDGETIDADGIYSLGIPDRGEIAPGKIADIVLVDEDLNPKMTIVNGEVKWHS